MKKQLIFVGLLAVGFASAQTDKAHLGKVGINIMTPQATIDIRPNDDNRQETATTNEGILIPKLSKTRVANIEDTLLVEGTLVYVTDDASSTIAAYTGNNAKVAKITEKGYYHYNGIEWVKNGNTVSEEFIPTTVTDIYGTSLNGVKLVDTSFGSNESRSLFAVSDKGGLYINSDEDARFQLYGNKGAELNVISFDNTYRGLATVLGGSESYGQIYIGTRNNISKDESLWSLQNVGMENTAPQVTNRLGDLGLRLNDKQIALFKKEGRVSIGSNTNPKASLSLSADLGEIYRTSTGVDRYDVLHVHERDNSAYGLGIHYSTLEIYGSDENSQIQIGSRASDGTGVFTPNVTFKGTGNIGIGLENPTEKLEVAGNIKSTALASTGNRRVYADKDGILKIGTEDLTSTQLAGLWVEDAATNSIKLAVTSAGVERTDNPVSITDTGLVKATSFQGSNGVTIFPDYVFQKYYTGNSSIKADYTFKTLSQVEDFVKTNGHLPGYKSAEAIKAQGYVDLMETQLTNVEKIEELYLHSIEQEKAIKAKDAKIQELEARLEKLEKLLK